ncbi:MAG TPA: extracellular solute-binding protein [Acidimicrobiales bacterium]|nr:extracellular solute-binding protein [Acidimicrobiales bacterium]
MKRMGLRRHRGLALAGAAVSCVSLSVGMSVGAGAAPAPRPAHMAVPQSNPFPKTLHGSFAFYSGGDTNIQQLWQQILIPSFNRAYPNVKVDYVFSEHGVNDVATLERVAQADKDKTSAGYALIESSTNAVELGARDHLFLPISSTNIPNSANVPSADMAVVDSDAVPYRGSKVVLAYNSADVSSPPTTLKQLIAWIQAHPGEFAYCNPNGGGSGQYFVQDVLNQYLSQADITKLAFTDDTSLESLWAQGMAQLHSLNSDMYGSGTYPAGNSQVLSLLGSGAVEMATVWSDQGTQALQDGQLPSTVKLVDITPPFAGSPVYLGIPKYTPPAQARLAEAFVNFVLSVPQQAKIVKAVAGFPGINVSVMTKTVKGEFTALGESESLPYSADIVSDLERVWQQDVP